jgi:hypothetical protein
MRRVLHLDPLDRLLVFPPDLWGWNILWGLCHKLQSGDSDGHHLRPHVLLDVLHQRRQGEGLVYRLWIKARATPGRLGEGRWKRSTRSRLLHPLDRPHLVHVHLIAIDIIDNIGIHRAVLGVGAGFLVGAFQSTDVAQTPRPVGRVQALRPLPRQLCLFSEERDEFGHELWMELVAGTIAEEVLVLDGLEEDGIGFTSKDQSFAGAVAGHVELSITVVLRGLPLGPNLSRQ